MGCDSRVEVTDAAAVPARYKRVTMTLPAETWELVCDSLDLDLREQVACGREVVEGGSEHEFGEGGDQSAGR